MFGQRDLPEENAHSLTGKPIDDGSHVHFVPRMRLVQQSKARHYSSSNLIARTMIPRPRRRPDKLYDADDDV